jgi:hypothetical protein
MFPVLRHGLRRGGKYLLGQLQPQMHDDGFADSSHELTSKGRHGWRFPPFRMGDITISNQGGVHDAKSG